MERRRIRVRWCSPRHHEDRVLEGHRGDHQLTRRRSPGRVEPCPDRSAVHSWCSQSRGCCAEMRRRAELAPPYFRRPQVESSPRRVALALRAAQASGPLPAERPRHARVREGAHRRLLPSSREEQWSSWLLTNGERHQVGSSWFQAGIWQLECSILERQFVAASKPAISARVSVHQRSLDAKRFVLGDQIKHDRRGPPGVVWPQLLTASSERGSQIGLHCIHKRLANAAERLPVGVNGTARPGARRSRRRNLDARGGACVCFLRGCGPSLLFAGVSRVRRWMERPSTGRRNHARCTFRSQEPPTCDCSHHHQRGCRQHSALAQQKQRPQVLHPGV